MTFAILVVCTGNICRSPAGERLLQHLLGPSVVVSSAGTHAVVGAPIEPEMAHLMSPQLATGGFAARQLRPAMLREADLVLPMTRAHRSLALEIFPAALRRTFTFREFARVLGVVGRSSVPGNPGEYLTEALPRAVTKRTLAAAADTALDDVIDPYRLDSEAFAVAYHDIHTAAVDIASSCGVSPTV